MTMRKIYATRRRSYVFNFWYQPIAKDPLSKYWQYLSAVFV